MVLPGHSWGWMDLLRPRANGRGYCTQSLRFSRNRREWAPYHMARRLGPRAVSIGSVDSLGVILYGKAVFIEAPALR